MNPAPGSPGRYAGRVETRWLEIDLAALEAGASGAIARAAPEFPDPWHARLAACSGLAAGLARLALAPPGDVPFVLAVGEAVRRGLPTAARLSVVGRAPLTGRPAEGQVGSDLARRLARVADVLAVRGRASRPGSVLVVDGAGEVRLESFPELAGERADAADRVLLERLGPCATLRIGPAGEARLPQAHLAAGRDPASRVGRGGLGAELGARGLKAIALTAEALEPRPDAWLVERLSRSPRLAARAAGGTFELAQALASGGALRGLGDRLPLGPDEGARLSDAARAAARGQHGCRGCPTPCGWTFAVGPGAAVGARFSAHHALGADLGLEAFEDGARLLARCDELGLDAKETGAGLALLARAVELGRLSGEAAFGRRAVFEGWLDELVAGRGTGARLARGARAAAEELGLGPELRALDEESAREPGSLAGLLARCVAVRGAEPMRAFAFLDGLDARRIARSIAPLAAPAGIEDPHAGAGKGRLVWWHENLAAALDATGFCAFSAAGLLADGLCTLDELARRIAPAGLPLGDAPGAALLGLGESVIGLHLELARRWGRPRPAPPAWARERLALPGVLDEYAALRGLDEELAPRPAARARWARLASAIPCAYLGPLEPPDATSLGRPAGPYATGRVLLCSGGALGEHLGRELWLELPLPAPLEAVLRAAEGERPRARGWLLAEGAILPVPWRDGRRLQGDAPVRDGDRIELVLAVSGG